MRATGKNAYDDATLRLLHDAMPVVEDVVRLAWAARSQPPAGPCGRPSMCARYSAALGRNC